MTLDFTLGFVLGLGAAAIPAIAFAEYAWHTRPIKYYEPEWTADPEMLFTLPETIATDVEATQNDA